MFDHDLSIYDWRSRFKRQGLTVSSRLELLECLAPHLKISSRIQFPGEEEGEPAAKGAVEPADEIHCELVLGSEHLRSALAEIANEPAWKAELPGLLDDFERLLLDGLRIMQEVGLVDEEEDRTYWYLPSIEEHWQNRGYHDWTLLIELVRDAWEVARSKSASLGAAVAARWVRMPFPVFRRLALFAATKEGIAPDGSWVPWVLEGGNWLWTSSSQREVMRLLAMRGPELSGAEKVQLEAEILRGPPRSMFVDDLTPERWGDIVDRSIWLRLARLAKSGTVLGPDAENRLREISERNSGWSLAANERDEFPQWMSGTGDPDWDENRTIDRAPRRRKDLEEWLRRPLPEDRFFYEDTWRDVCREEFASSVAALCSLGRSGVWPVARWREALQAWSDDLFAKRSWRWVSPMLSEMPAETFAANVQSIGFWLRTVSKKVASNRELYVSLCNRVLDSKADDGVDTNDALTRAINHPVGYVTEGLINVWFNEELRDNQLVPNWIRGTLDRIVDDSEKSFQAGRVILSSRIISLFRIDVSWTMGKLIPLLDWARSIEEAAISWQGFLWSPRIYRPLLSAAKRQFLDTSLHLSNLGSLDKQYVTFLTFLALDPSDTFGIDELASTFAKLDQEHLEQAADALTQTIESAGDQRENYWSNRVRPFWYRIWPKGQPFKSDKLSTDLARIAIAAGQEFPDALVQLGPWMSLIEHSHYVSYLLEKSDLPAKFPRETVALLEIVVRENSWISEELSLVLSTVLVADPSLADDHRYRRLLLLSRRGR